MDPYSGCLGTEWQAFNCSFWLQELKYHFEVYPDCQFEKMEIIRDTDEYPSNPNSFELITEERDLVGERNELGQFSSWFSWTPGEHCTDDESDHVMICPKPTPECEVDSQTGCVTTSTTCVSTLNNAEYVISGRSLTSTETLRVIEAYSPCCQYSHLVGEENLKDWIHSVNVGKVTGDKFTPAGERVLQVGLATGATGVSICPV